MAVSRLTYVSREQFKVAASVYGPDQNARIDRILQSTATKFESDSRTWFVPRSYAQDVTLPLLPSLVYGPYGVWARIPLPAHLQSASAVVLSTAATVSQALTETTEYRFSPDAAPYTHIEIATAQIDPIYGFDILTGWTLFRPYVTITGVWSHRYSLEDAGTLVGAVSDTVSSLVVSDASLVGVGDMLLLGSEQILVADRSALDTTADLGANIDDQMSTTLITLTAGGGSLVNTGEVVTVDAERMYVEAITGDALVVKRAYDGSVLASHLTGAALYADRTLRVVRPQGGTTAASHLDGAAISAYRAPDDVRNAVMAKAIATIEQEQAGYGRVVGTGEGAKQYSGKAVADEWGCDLRIYRRGWVMA